MKDWASSPSRYSISSSSVSSDGGDGVSLSLDIMNSRLSGIGDGSGDNGPIDDGPAMCETSILNTVHLIYSAFPQDPEPELRVSNFINKKFPRSSIKL